MSRGTLCLIDWKTSNKPKASLEDCYDYPLQAVAYAGAINHDPNFDFKVLPHVCSYTMSGWNNINISTGTECVACDCVSQWRACSRSLSQP